MKKAGNYISPVIILLCWVFGLGCKKNLSAYYEDPNNPLLAVFSDKGYNIMTCLIDGQSWQTYDRTISGIGGLHSEVRIQRIVTSSLYDTLIISWHGHYRNNNDASSDINLILPIAKGFRPRDLNSFDGTRMVIDSSNGFFAYTPLQSNYYVNGGLGTIYFQKFQIDSIAVNNYSGEMSGLFQTHVGSTVIANARFDHSIGSGQLQFY
jgi:hypothetical protein